MENNTDIATAVQGPGTERKIKTAITVGNTSAHTAVGRKFDTLVVSDLHYTQTPFPPIDSSTEHHGTPLEAKNSINLTQGNY